MDLKPEFDPLLSEGLHTMTLVQVRQLCVDAFPGNQRRAAMMAGLEKFVGRLGQLNLPCEMWIDGSFLTWSPSPDDIDVVLGIAEHVQESPSGSQEEGLNWLRDVPTVHADTYVRPGTFTAKQLGAADYWITANLRAYWERQYGRSVAGKAKGIAVVFIGTPQ